MFKKYSHPFPIGIAVANAPWGVLTLSTATKKLEKNYQQKIDNLDELKKSILKKAFAGKL